MRFGLFVLALSGALLLAAFMVAEKSDTASAQQTVTVTMGPATGPAGGGSQTGSATLTTVGTQTQVVLNIDPSPDGAGVAQPAHIHAGTCATLGAIVHPLTDVVNGASTTTVNATLDSVMTGSFAINVHKSGTELGVYVSCGNIPAAAAAADDAADTAALPTSGGPPPTSGDSPSAWTYALIAAGTLALLGSGALGLRHQR